ncbi:putative Brf1p family coiled coil protein, partial [Toxoplasma gondii p89]
PLRAMLDEARTKLLELRALKREEQEKYFALVKQRQEATAPGRELIEERDRLSKQMSEHMIKMREERARRQIEQERANLERQLEMVDEEPVDGELILLTQTIAYVQKIMDEHNQTQDGSPGTEQKKTPEAVSRKMLLNSFRVGKATPSIVGSTYLH